ncbi:MAG: hypothetical protein ACO34E_03355 [Limisphaerales bacterium]
MNTQPAFLLVLVAGALSLGCPLAADFETTARALQGDLRLSTYITAHTVQALSDDDRSLAASVPVLRSMGISKVYLEVYRSGLVVSRDRLERVRDFLLERGYPVAAGIATVPGGDFGVAANAGLGWFNWQAAKTQDDLRQVVRTAAAGFDEFIVDDFLCTGDLSEESLVARGDRSWPEYRQDLLTRLAGEVFIQPAREVNPDIRMIIKYPQWYDRFHLFGYDVARESPVFDAIWVGTETRGARTQRFGFTQPYEGFVNYRWISSVAGQSPGGGWFDHGDCDGPDFVEQAWQTVLAGAQEIVLFNYSNLAAGHPGHALLREDFPALARLARAVREHPVVGTPAYKPVNSDAGSDLYLMDALGMLGIPILPVARFPQDAPVVFLPTQAAADGDVFASIETALGQGRDLVLTAGFLGAMRGRAEAIELARIAGVSELPIPSTITARQLDWPGNRRAVEPALRLHGALRPSTATTLLAADGHPFVTLHTIRDSRVWVLNSHTYSQEDFDAVGEVLLPPTPLGLLEIPDACAAVLRQAFLGHRQLILEGPPRVTLQPLGDAGWLIQNYNEEKVSLKLGLPPGIRELRNVLNGDSLSAVSGQVSLWLHPRSRIWIEPAD